MPFFPPFPAIRKQTTLIRPTDDVLRLCNNGQEEGPMTIGDFLGNQTLQVRRLTL